MNNAEAPAKTKTLAQQLSEGRLPAQDGLLYAAQLAEALRKVHDEGRAHGGVTPDVIGVDQVGLELMPACASAAGVTPYTAPEVAAQNRPADARSDIFSFGAIVYEMLTGRKAFVGEPEAVLIASLCNSAAAPTGSPAVDRLVGGCLAKDPAARWQRMQKIILELKLLTAAAKRTATATPSARPAAEAVLRAEMQQIESRMAARLQAHAEAAAQAHQSIANNLRGEFSSVAEQMGARLASQEQSNAQAHQAVGDALNTMGGHLSAVKDQFAARLQIQEQTAAQAHQAVLDALNGIRGDVSATGEQLGARVQVQQDQFAQAHQSLGEEVSSFRGEVAATHQQLAARMQSHEEALAGHQGSIHSTVEALKEQFAEMSGQLAAAHEKLSQSAAVSETARIAESIDGMHKRLEAIEQAAQSGANSALEANVEALKQHLTELNTNVAADMHEFELNMKAQANAIESARTAMAQTDDLVERVVEALEALQSTVLEHADERAMALN
jgi:hypothetical protein